MAKEMNMFHTGDKHFSAGDSVANAHSKFSHTHTHTHTHTHSFELTQHSKQVGMISISRVVIGYTYICTHCIVFELRVMEKKKECSKQVLRKALEKAET